MSRTLATLALCAALAGPVHAADTGRLVEHLFHHTYLVRQITQLCLPGGCVALVGPAHLLYDDDLVNHIDLRCDETGDGCEWFETSDE